MSANPLPVAPSVPLDDTDHIYTIIVRGESFQLDHAQVHFDSPNFFSNCFSSGFAEATTRVLRLHRNPTTFAIIVDYLSGYPILPLATHAHALPRHMDVVVLHRYLLEDARFYELQGLCDLLTTPKPFTDLRWTGYGNEMVSLWDLARGELPEGVVRQADGSIMSEESGLPVLAYARDVVIRVSLMQLAVHEISWKPPDDVLLTLVTPNETSPSDAQDIHLSTCGTFPSSRGTSEPPSIGSEARDEYWCRRNGIPMTEYGRLLVDGHSCGDLPNVRRELTGWSALRGVCQPDLGVSVSNSENWISCYREDHYGRAVHWELRRIIYVTFTLLAESFICRIRPWTGIGPKSPLEPIPVDLVRASLRTKRSILDGLGAQI